MVPQELQEDFSERLLASARQAGPVPDALSREGGGRRRPWGDRRSSSRPSAGGGAGLATAVGLAAPAPRLGAGPAGERVTLCGRGLSA